MIAEVAQVKTLVADGEVEKAIDLLAQVLAISDADLQNEVFLLSARFAKLRSQTRKGILTKEQENLEYARIVDGVLEISDEAADDEEMVAGFVNMKAHWEAAAQKFDADLAEYLQRAVMRRMVFIKELGLQFRMLWVDDNLDQIMHEKAVLETLPLSVDLASSSTAAVALLAENPDYDLILSDIGRAEDPTAGFSLAEQLLREEYAAPFIFYTLPSDQPLLPPANTFGIAYLPNELYHLVLDVMARKE